VPGFGSGLLREEEICTLNDIIIIIIIIRITDILNPKPATSRAAARRGFTGIATIPAECE
jgi:hypothetical protein